MAKLGHSVHIPEDYSEKDMSRATFHRPPGHVGIYMEIRDAQPENEKDYGSHLYFLRQAAESFGEHIKKIPLDVVKGYFSRRQLLSGVIFEEYHEDNVLSVGFETEEALSALRQLHEKEALTTIMQQIFVTDATLRQVGAKFFKLDVRLFDDEFDECHSEMKQGLVKPVPLTENEHDKDMIRKVKRYRAKLAERIMTLKDALGRFEKILGEFIMIMKQNLPEDVESITTYTAFMDHVKAIKRRRGKEINGKVLDEYTKVIKCIVSTIAEVEDHILHPLLQVHAACETSNQRELKRKMEEALNETKRHLHKNYNFYNLNHKEWQSKILLREQKLFLGLISVLPKSVDTVIDVDAQTDEYLSAVQIKIKA